MNARNRNADVVKLRSNACQDLLKMIVKPNWKEELINIINYEVDSNGKYKEKYINEYHKIHNYGAEEYKIDDMDVSFIYEVIRHHKRKICRPEIKDKTLDNILDNIKGDRNKTNHSSENETDSEIYSRALLSLEHLEKLINNVGDYLTDIEVEIKDRYRQKYTSKINSLKEIIIKEALSHNKVEKDVQSILNSDKPWFLWHEIIMNYYKDKNPPFYNEEYCSFVTLCADKGIHYAYFDIVSMYYHKNDSKSMISFIHKILNEDNVDNDVIYAVNTGINLKWGELSDTWEVTKATDTDVKSILKAIEEKGFEVKPVKNELSEEELKKLEKKDKNVRNKHFYRYEIEPRSDLS